MPLRLLLWMNGEKNAENINWQNWIFLAFYGRTWVPRSLDCHDTATCNGNPYQGCSNRLKNGKDSCSGSAIKCSCGQRARNDAFNTESSKRTAIEATRTQAIQQPNNKLWPGSMRALGLFKMAHSSDAITVGYHKLARMTGEQQTCFHLF